MSGGDSGSTSTAPPVLFSAPTLSNVFAAPLNALKSIGSMHWGSHDELEASDEEEGDDEEASHSGEDMVLHTSSEEDEPRQPSKRAPAAHVLGAARAKRQGGGGATRVVIGPDGQKHYVPTNFISKPQGATRDSQRANRCGCPRDACTDGREVNVAVAAEGWW